MILCKRILAGLTFLLSSVGLLLSLAGGIGVWIVKGPVTARATHVFERTDAALDVADEGLDRVEKSLARAAKSLEEAKKKQSEIARQAQPNRLRQTLARTVQQQIAPEVGDANEKLHTVAEAAVVVNSVLEDVGTFPFLSTSGLDLDRLAEMNSRLSGVAPAAWELSRLLGEPEPDPDAAGDQLSKVERALESMRKSVADYQSQVTQVRQRTEALKSRTLPWITPAAALISVVCFWIALSQISLLFHACSWWRHAAPHHP
jgi:hypothetical protein